MCGGRTRTRQQQSRGSQLCSTAAIKVWADGMGRREGEESEAAAEHISHGLVNGLKTFPRQEPLGGGAKERDTQRVWRGRENLFLTRVGLTKIAKDFEKDNIFESCERK